MLAIKEFVRKNCENSSSNQKLKCDSIDSINCQWWMKTYIIFFRCSTQFVLEDWIWRRKWVKSNSCRIVNVLNLCLHEIYLSFPLSACIFVAFSPQQQVSNATKQPNLSIIIANLYQIQRAKIKAIVKDEFNSHVSMGLFSVFPQHLVSL